MRGIANFFFPSRLDDLQRLKHHPYFRNLLEGGTRIAYGARSLVHGRLLGGAGIFSLFPHAYFVDQFQY